MKIRKSEIEIIKLISKLRSIECNGLKITKAQARLSRQRRLKLIVISIKLYSYAALTRY